jgi:thiol-disulfide isomerase/thioredoxin
VGAALLVACAPARMPPSSPSALLGGPAPDLRSRAVAGAALDPSSLAGKVVVLDFFAEYCKPCRPRLALSERLRRELPGAVFLGVSLDETAEAAQRQVSRIGVGFPVLHDPQHVLAGRFRVAVLPSVIVIGRGGEVAWVGGPEQSEAAIRQAIRAAL